MFSFAIASPPRIECSPPLLRHAQKDILRLKRVAPAVWVEEVFDSFLKFRACDDNQMSFSYDKTITYLFLKNGKKSLIKLTNYLNKNPEFAEFFFIHVLSNNNSKEDLDSVRSLLDKLFGN